MWAGPRQQLLAAKVNELAGVIVTHAHGDHCHGIDELRPVSQANGGPVAIHARADVLDELRRRFDYAFAQSDFYRPVVRRPANRAETSDSEMFECASSISLTAVR